MGRVMSMNTFDQMLNSRTEKKKKSITAVPPVATWGWLNKQISTDYYFKMSIFSPGKQKRHVYSLLHELICFSKRKSPGFQTHGLQLTFYNLLRHLYLQTGGAKDCSVSATASDFTAITCFFSILTKFSMFTWLYPLISMELCKFDLADFNARCLSWR